MRLAGWLLVPSLLALLLLTGCGGAPTPTPPPTSAEQSADIQGFAFNPPDLTVPAGTTVTWTNLDTAAHTVSSTGTPSGQGFDSGSVSQGQTFPFTFTVAGTYEYQCNIHPFMKGAVLVAE